MVFQNVNSLKTKSFNNFFKMQKWNIYSLVFTIYA